MSGEITETQCPHCEAGWTPAQLVVYRALGAFLWNDTALRDPAVRQIATFLVGREPHGSFIGYDSIAASKAVDKLGKLAGLDPSWTVCQHCDGEGRLLTP